MPKVMGIVGSRTQSKQMCEMTSEATVKAFNAGWRVATGGGLGTDATVIETALSSGNAGNLDIYLPQSIDKQPLGVRSLIKQAQTNGANVIEYAGGTTNMFGEPNETYIQACHNRNAEIVKNSNAINAFQNNNSRGTQSTINKAKAAGLKVKTNSFLSGILRSSTLFGCFGVLAGALNAFLTYQDQLDLEKYLQGLKDKPIDELTEEEKGILQDAGWLTDAGEWTGIGMDDTKFVLAKGKGGNRGNPYHDKQGRFCSAANAVTVSG